ncbi:MAG: NAD-dependent epimerase/dehydratase family protein [Burkholderiales bacterium]|nr:NAD-dependent epimerase/dehydratase family protein [Burkholderiales bacterium]
MKIAVTGASGFIGRHLLAELSKHSVEILATTRNSAGLEAWRDKVQILEIDIEQASRAQLECLARVDVLIHLAWGGLPNYKSRHHFESELPKQYGFLKKLIERGLPSLLVAGTCLEYGYQSGELSEECRALPEEPYAFAKDSLRRQLEFLRRDHKFSMTWARLFYIYGEGQPATSLYPQLMAAASRGDKNFDMSGGEQLRDYLPVVEVARLLGELARRRVYARVVNICSGRPVSVRRLVEGWIEDNDWQIGLNLGSYAYPDYEPMAFWGCRHKLDDLLISE